MFFSGVLSTWKESLNLFRWSNFKLFLLVSLKTTIRTLTLLITNFWWLIGIFIILRLTLPGVAHYFSFILMFAYFLILRPSLEPKDWLYFKTYFYKLWRFFVIVLYNMILPIFMFVFAIFFFGFFFKGATLQKLLLPGGIVWGVAVVFFTPVSISYSFGTFFVFDAPRSEYTWHSFIRGLKAVWFYAPFTLFVTVLFCCIEFIRIKMGVAGDIWRAGAIPLIVYQIVYIFCLSLIVNYYVKIKHTNRKLFFK